MYFSKIGHTTKTGSQKQLYLTHRNKHQNEETKKYDPKKRQIKTPEKELNEMEISKLSDAQFQTLVITMLKEVIGYCTSIKKIQAEMKVALSEIKKNLQGTNNGGMNSRIKSMIWNRRKEKAFNQNIRKKKEFKQNKARP